MAVVQTGRSQVDPPIKTYLVNGDYYDIPKADEVEFLNDFKDAREVVSYKVGEDQYDILPEEVAEFSRDFPNAIPLHTPKEEIENIQSGSLPDSLLQNELSLVSNGGGGTPDFSPVLSSVTSESTAQRPPENEFKNVAIRKKVFNPDYFKSSMSDIAKETEEKIKHYYNTDNVQVKIGQIGRDADTQAQYQASGASRTPLSMHQFGAGADFQIFIDDKLVSGRGRTDELTESVDPYRILGGVAKERGYFWGYNWDSGHVSQSQYVDEFLNDNPEYAFMDSVKGLYRNYRTSAPASLKPLLSRMDAIYGNPVGRKYHGEERTSDSLLEPIYVGGVPRVQMADSTTMSPEQEMVAESEGRQGAFEAFGRGAIAYAPETLGGIGGSALAIAMFSNPIGAIAGGLVFGLLGAFGTGAIKNAILEEANPEFKAELDAQLERDLAEHPVASFMGQVAPSMLALKPNAKNVKNSIKFAKHLVKNWDKKDDIFMTEAGREGVSNLVNVMAGSGVEGGVEMYRQVESGDWSGVRLALALTAGAFINEPNKVGRAIGFKPTKVFMRDVEAIQSGLKTSKQIAMEGGSPKTRAVSDESLPELRTADKGAPTVESWPDDGQTILPRSERIRKDLTANQEEIVARQEAVDEIDVSIRDLDDEIAYIDSEINVIKKSSREELDNLNVVDRKAHLEALANDKKALKEAKKDLHIRQKGAKADINKKTVANKKLRKELSDMDVDGDVSPEMQARTDAHVKLKAEEDALMSRWKSLDADDPEKIVIERRLQSLSDELNMLSDEGIDITPPVDDGIDIVGVANRKLTKRVVMGKDSEPMLLTEGGGRVGLGSRVRVAGIGKHSGKKADVVKVYKNGNMKVRFDEGGYASIKGQDLEVVSRPVKPKKGQVHIDPEHRRLVSGLQDLKDEGKMGEATGERVVMEGDRDMGAEPAHRVPMERDKPVYAEVEDNFVRQSNGSWIGKVGNRTFKIIRMRGDNIYEGGGFGWYDLDKGQYLGRTKREAIRTLQQVKDAPLRGVAYDSPKNIEGQEITGVAREEGVLSEKPFSIERGRERTIDRVFKAVDEYEAQGSVPSEHRRTIHALKGNAKTWDKKIKQLEADPNFDPTSPEYVRAKSSMDRALKRLEDSVSVSHMQGATFGLEMLPFMRRIVDAFDNFTSSFGSKSGKASLRAINKREKELLDRLRMGDKSVEEELDMLSMRRAEINGKEIENASPNSLKKLVVEEETPATKKKAEKFVEKIDRNSKGGKFVNALVQLQHRSNNKYFQSLVRMLQRSHETQHRILGMYYESLRPFKIDKLKPHARERLADLLEGHEPDMNNALDRKLVEIRDVMRELYDRMHRDAIDVGIDVKGYIKDYLPMMLNREATHDLYTRILTLQQKLELDIKGKGRGEAYSDRVLMGILNKEQKRKTELAGLLENLIETGQAKDLNEAFRKLRYFTGETLFRPFANMEKHRRLVLPNKYLERDAVKIFERYLNGYATRFAEVKNMGGPTTSDFTLNHKLLSFEDSDLARDAQLAYKMWNGTIYMDETIGAKSMKNLKYMSTATSFLVGTKIGLGFATIPNLFQTLYSVWTRVGTKSYLRGIAQFVFSPKMRREMRESGIVVDDAIKAMANIEYDGPMQRVTDRLLRMSGFNAVNKMNNYISASSGRQFIKNLYKKAGKSGRSAQRARRTLRRYGFNYTKQPSDERMANFMFRFATDTQLLRNVARDPIAFHDPRLQWMFLFKKFGIKQVQLVKDDLRALHRDGDYQGLAGYVTRLGLATGMAGVGGEALRNLYKSKIGPKEDYRRIPANEFEDFLEVLANAGSLGIVGDMIASGYYTKNPASALIRAVTPTHVDFALEVVEEMGQFMYEAFTGYGFKNAFMRSLPRSSGLLGSVPSIAFGERLRTGKQQKGYVSEQKGKAKKRIFEAIMNKRRDSAREILWQYNRNHPENMLRIGDLNRVELEKYLKRRLDKKNNY